MSKIIKTVIMECLICNRVKRSLFRDKNKKIKTFAIISPQNPLGWKNTSEEEFKQKYLKWKDNPVKYNSEQLKQIKSEVLADRIIKTGENTLKVGHFNFVEIKGHYGNAEKSLMIFNIPFLDAKLLAKNYGQESFFYGIVHEDHSEIAYYESTDGTKTYHHVEISKTITDESEAEDFFSKYGFKFKINMKIFGDSVTPIENQGEFEESFNLDRTFMSRALHRRNAYKK